MNAAGRSRWWYRGRRDDAMEAKAKRRVGRLGAGWGRDAAAGLLAEAGVALDGRAACDIQVHDDRMFARVLAQGQLGLGESYMAGWFDCDALDEFVCRVLRAGLHGRVGKRSLLVPYLRARYLNPQRVSRAAGAHYNLGNDLFEAMLDDRMTYSCGYWPGTEDLDVAQTQKLDLACRKLGLAPGMRVLDIGCGFGAFARYAAETYGVAVVGVAVSEAQLALGRERCAGLDVELRMQDYRDVTGKFDRVVSIGMFEHVGHKNYRRFMQVVRDRLKDNSSLFLLHTIGGQTATLRQDAWIAKYIFPDYMLPTIQQIGAAAEGIFVAEDWHNFGGDYDKTLMAWWRNFDGHWPALRVQYGERFYRTWRYYLLFCAGVFRARYNQVWQIVFSPLGVCGGYTGAR